MYYEQIITKADEIGNQSLTWRGNMSEAGQCASLN